MSGRRFDVCAAVVSDLTYDARVWKEARSLAAAGYRVALLGCRYDLERPRWRRQDGVYVFEVSLGTRARVSILRRAATLLRLWLEILRVRARAYHAHNIHVGPAAFLAARLRRARLVYDAHELFGEVHGGRLERAAVRLEAPLERLLVTRSDGVVTTNESRVAALRDRYGDVDVVTLGNVPQLVEDVEPLDPGYPNGRPVLLYQGGVYAESRAFRETLEALRLLDGVEFVVIGFGRERDLALVRRWAEETGTSERVHILPARPFDELVRTAAAATVGLVPVNADSLNNFLGDTNKLFEYLMAGIPVAGSDLPEMRRVLVQGEPPVGELFDPRDPESIAAAVRRLLEDPDVYQARRREARRLAVERYNWRVEERKLLSLYERLIGRPADGART